MRNPVDMAFYMDWLDPEDRAAIMRWRIRLAVFCGLLVLILAPLIAARAGDLERRAEALLHGADDAGRAWPRIGVSGAIAAEPGGITQCALRDLQLVTSIEARGEAQDVPGGKLAAAFFAVVEARRACDAGRIDEALAVYDGIVIALAEARKE
jgi:hypothetical protein